jgi:glyoxalase family protein
MQLNGIHHVTAVSAKIGQNVDFYTRVLGMRLVKKSVNQDDVSAYHLFYADKIGSPGTDMTFFDWPDIGSNRQGTDSIAATAFRVNGQKALEYWQQRLTDLGVPTQGVERFANHNFLSFQDPEGQRLMLVDDRGAEFEGEIWDQSQVPTDYAIRGFYAIMLSVPSLERIDPILTNILQFRRAGQSVPLGGKNVVIYETASGGPGREIWLVVEPDQPVARLGAGGVHHVAFRVRDETEQRYWLDRVRQAGLHASAVIDRFYFQSIYFRISNGILFEIATDGPGFTADEDLDTLGEKLALPPFLEPHRAGIEAGLKPIQVASVAA